MARRVLAALDAPFRDRGTGDRGQRQPRHHRLSPTMATRAERLMRNADMALYRAKAAGRSRFEPYGREHGPRAARGQEAAARPAARARRGRAGARLPAGIRAAAASGWRRSRRSCAGITPAAGSAARDLHPDRGGIGADPSPRRVGAARACRQAAIWRDAGRPLKVAVNVSAAQLRGPSLPGLVPRRARRGGPAPRACSSSS